VEGLAKNRYEIKVWAAKPSNYQADGAEITSVAGNIISLLLRLPDNGIKYAQKKIILSSDF
jgi:hypothetical protein